MTEVGLGVTKEASGGVVCIGKDLIDFIAILIPLKSIHMFLRIFYISVLWIISNSCGTKENKESVNLKTPTDSIAQSKDLSRDRLDFPDRGLVKKVEDSGYPFATLTIEFPELKFTEYFTINLEEVKNVSLGDIELHVGKYVKYKYTSEKSYTLLDVYKDSQSIFGSEFPAERDDIKSIEGVLKGAKQVTAGDIPSEVSITTKNGENLFFQYFITHELLAVNGKKVTGFYDERTLKTIKSIQLIEN